MNPFPSPQLPACITKLRPYAFLHESKVTQIVGGIHSGNAGEWLAAGASHVIVTSWLFTEARFTEARVRELVEATGAARLVIDLSFRRSARGWTVAMDRWQTLTDLDVTPATLDRLAPWCDEFLIHAADVEGLCGGIDGDLCRCSATGVAGR